MNFVEDFKKTIFKINEKTFEDSSLAVFEFQYRECEIYQSYCKSLGKTPSNVFSIKDIPFLPIEFFKNHAIKSGRWHTQKIFQSSGTTSSERSKHYIPDLMFYHQIAKTIFEFFFGDLRELELIALLPSYLEQGDSSLISMVDHLMNFTSDESGYYLKEDIQKKLKSDHRKILFGVSYALLDATANINSSENTIIVETGGMKGRKKEITRTELHDRLMESYAPKEIWSEYGMTELQSQAYGKYGSLKFPAWARVLIREINDPFNYLENGKSGGINVIDLANIQTCSFIETKDLGKINGDSFEVLGRFDNSDVRGCNLMV